MSSEHTLKLINLYEQFRKYNHGNRVVKQRRPQVSQNNQRKSGKKVKNDKIL